MMMGTWIASQGVPASTGAHRVDEAVDGQEVGERHGERRHRVRVQDHEAVAHERRRRSPRRAPTPQARKSIDSYMLEAGMRSADLPADAGCPSSSSRSRRAAGPKRERRRAASRARSRPGSRPPARRAGRSRRCGRADLVVADLAVDLRPASGQPGRRGPAASASSSSGVGPGRRPTAPFGLSRHREDADRLARTGTPAAPSAGPRASRRRRARRSAGGPAAIAAAGLLHELDGLLGADDLEEGGVGGAGRKPDLAGEVVAAQLDDRLRWRPPADRRPSRSR